MKVFVVTFDHPHEYGPPVGVYSTLEKAEAAAKDCERFDHSFCDLGEMHYETVVHEFDLDQPPLDPSGA